MKKIVIIILIFILLGIGGYYFFEQYNTIKENSISLSETELSLDIGEKKTLLVTFDPLETTDKTIFWMSSDDKIVTVDQAGNLLAISEGEATIIAKSVNDKTTSCKVKVKKPIIYVESIVLDKNEIELEINKSETVVPTINPFDATDKKLVWTSSDPSVASVENGVIFGNKIGSATITCENNGIEATVTVKVYEYFDIGLFWGQSNMAGRAGKYAGEKKTSNVKSLKNVDADIISKTESYARVIVDMPKNVAFEYKVGNNALYDISDNPIILGESIFYNGGNLSSKQDNGKNIQVSSGTNMIPYFAKEYYEQTNNKLIAVFAASGGMAISKFLPNSSANLYKIMTLKFKKAEEYILKQNEYYRIRNRFYVVYQGEADATSSLANYYERDYLTVHDSLMNDLNLSVGAMVYLVRGDMSYKNTYVQKVRSLQQKMVNERENLIMGTDFPYKELSNGNKSILCPSSNAIHINASGLSQIGREIAKSIANSNKIQK